MAISEQYQADAAVILSHRHDNGGDLWTTPDGRILKGGPFSTVECVGVSAGAGDGTVGAGAAAGGRADLFRLAGGWALQGLSVRRDLSLSDSFGGPGAVPLGMCGGCPDAEDVSAFSGHAVPGWRLAVQ